MPKINLVEVGQRIKEIRKYQLRLTGNEFGKLVDGSTQSVTISNWEHGKNLPNAERLHRIAELGHTTADYLLYGVSRQCVWTYCGDNLWHSGCGFESRIVGNLVMLGFNFCTRCGREIDIKAEIRGE